MKKLLRRIILGLALLLITVFCGQLAQAKPPMASQIIITGAYVDFSQNPAPLFIYGENFDNGNYLSIFLGNTEIIDIASYTTNESRDLELPSSID